MMTKNYVRAYGLPWRAYFFYLDREPWLADRFFIANGLRVHFNNAYELPDQEYVIVTCWVYAWQVERFERCMFELSRLSILSGRDDYIEACHELSWLFERSL